MPNEKPHQTLSYEVHIPRRWQTNTRSNMNIANKNMSTARSTTHAYLFLWRRNNNNKYREKKNKIK